VLSVTTQLRTVAFESRMRMPPPWLKPSAARPPRIVKPSSTGVDEAGSAKLPSMSTTDHVGSNGSMIDALSAGSRTVKVVFQPPSRVTLSVITTLST
jgi:hypothetical protein